MKITAYEDGKIAVLPSGKPTKKEGEVVVKVKASGICGSDGPRALGGKAYYYPIVVGHEFAGIIEDNDSPLDGKRVCIFPILPCKECEFCKNEQYANCTNYDYYGSRRDGGMQDYLAVKEENLIFLPDGVSYEEGAMIEPTAVCLHGVKKLSIKSGDNVVIYGAGTIGLLCAMWCKDFGADNIYLVDIDEKKLDLAKSLGFKAYNGEKVSVAIEASGAGVCLNKAIESIDAFGRLLVIGNTSSDVTIKKENYAKILRKQLSLFGTWNSDFSSSVNDWQDSLTAINDKRINPSALITHRFLLEEGDKAFEVVRNREFYNKIMVVTK
jgi:L-iditol 2-dehydrogenase